MTSPSRRAPSHTVRLSTSTRPFTRERGPRTTDFDPIMSPCKCPQNEQARGFDATVNHAAFADHDEVAGADFAPQMTFHSYRFLKHELA